MHWGFKVLIGASVGAFLLYEWHDVTKKHKKRQLVKAQQLLIEAEKVENPQQQEYMLHEALKIYQGSLPADDLHIGAIYNNLAHVSLAMDKIDEAKTFAEKSLVVLRAKLGPDHRRVADTLLMLGACSQTISEHREAKQYVEEAVRIFEKTAETDSDKGRLSAALKLLTTICISLQDYDTAVKLLNRWEALHQPVLARPNLDKVTLHATVKTLIEVKVLATRVFSEQKRYDEAEQMYREVIQLVDDRLGPKNINKAFILEDYADFLHEKEDLVAAEAKFREAIAIASEVAPTGAASASSTEPSALYMAKSHLAHFYYATDRDTEGRAILDELRGLDSLPSPSRSKYLATQSSGFAFENEGGRPEGRLRPFYHLAVLPTTKLPKGSTLVAAFEDPSTGERIRTKPVTYTGQPIIGLKSEAVSGAKRGAVYETLVEVYSDADQTKKIGVHYQFCMSKFNTDAIHQQEDMINQMPKEELVALIARAMGKDPAEIEAAMDSGALPGPGAIGGGAGRGPQMRLAR